MFVDPLRVLLAVPCDRARPPLRGRRGGYRAGHRPQRVPRPRVDQRPVHAVRFLPVHGPAHRLREGCQQGQFAGLRHGGVEVRAGHAVIELAKKAGQITRMGAGPDPGPAGIAAKIQQ